MGRSRGRRKSSGAREQPVLKTYTCTAQTAVNDPNGRHHQHHHYAYYTTGHQYKIIRTSCLRASFKLIAPNCSPRTSHVIATRVSHIYYLTAMNTVEEGGIRVVASFAIKGL